ncbi:hypothetical protein [Xiamenia xianingshaonis]|uniref:Uncharacterized protein n=1 Tax=Xiamenia xianingshaonis TaxID=2682776 RepID=A0A9E6SUY3_9ACTN|nr:hypothetical protein [Xiamenia xianingshaonis]NHM14420.1 hypothetical protein [Xiamenia xianingshaonis]QTU84894.1 hypothetical protein J7S26_02995 [Xiamenia xianingshaonis]
MKMKAGVLSLTLSLSLLAMPLMGGCSGGGEDKAADEGGDAQTTSLTANDTKADGEAASTEDGKKDAKAAESAKMKAALSDSLGFAKIETIDGVNYAAEFGDATTPAQGESSIGFAPNGAKVTFDVSYVIVYDSQGQQLAPESVAAAVKAGDVVELGGTGEGDAMVVNTMELVNQDGTPSTASAQGQANGQATDGATDASAADVSVADASAPAEGSETDGTQAPAEQAAETESDGSQAA